MFPAGLSGQVFYNKITDLGTAMFGAAKTNPVFQRDSKRSLITHKGEDLFTMCTWEPLCRSVATSQPIDGSPIHCLLMIEALYRCPPYHEVRDIADADWQLRPDSTKALIGTAKARKLWLSGDKEEEMECLHLVFRAIRGALVKTSQYAGRWALGSNVVYNQFSESGNKTRERLCSEIAVMLDYDTRVATLVLDGETLTMLADKWKTLGLWREALQRAGLHSDKVMGSD
jgi:hypothetical protein